LKQRYCFWDYRTPIPEIRRDSKIDIPGKTNSSVLTTSCFFTSFYLFLRQEKPIPSNMELNYSGIALFVKDIEISKDFYSNILNLKIELDFGKNVIYRGGITIWEIDENHIIPSSLGQERVKNANNNRIELYFETENLQEVYEELKGRGTHFLHEIHEEPWGQRTIRFFDPDNHLIEVGKSMRLFVTRFYELGLSLEEVSARTSVPAEEVMRLVGKVSLPAAPKG
jgi:catechol 2,3-dioxygenase-like lactoylglutathione lyase family enzyme